MLDLATILPFFGASVLLGLAPGPDNIFVLTQSAVHGRSAGLVVTLGLCTGLLVHTAAVAFGVAALIQSSPLAFSLLKYAGAAYLLYLAWMSWRAGAQHMQGEAAASPGLRGLWGRGVIMNITNPKVTIFFLAFLPQFVVTERGAAWAQMLQLGGLFIVATLLVFSSVAMLSGVLGDSLRRSQLGQVIINRVAAVVFVALALKLVLPGAGH